MKTDRIAKKLHCSAETVRDVMVRPSSRWSKMLKHSDWRARREGDNQERDAVLRAEA